MNDTTEQVLDRAFELIEDGRLEDAQRLLKPLIDADRNNPDVWWLYAHAVTDPEAAQIALQNVLRLDKDYPEAQTLLKNLESKLPTRSFLDSRDQEPFDLPDMPATLPGLSPVKEPKQAAPPSRFGRRLLIPVAVLLTMILVIVAVLSLRNNAPGSAVSSPAPTSEAIAATFTPIQSQTVGEYEALYAALAGFSLPEQGGIETISTNLGNTLVATLCESSRRQAREILPNVLDILANQTDSLSSDVAAVGARIQDCSTGNAWIAIGVPRGTAEEYASGTLDSSGFEATWTLIQ